MLTYYIDEPLSPIEQQMVIEQINVISTDAAKQLIFKRIPDHIPTNESELSHTEIIKVFEDILVKLEIPIGVQSTFILPKGGLSWGMLLQIAFKNVSKFYPFVVQPWEMNADRIHKRREHILVTDINGAMPA